MQIHSLNPDVATAPESKIQNPKWYELEEVLTFYTGDRAAASWQL